MNFWTFWVQLNHIFQVFLEKKNKQKSIIFFVVLRTPQRIRRFACLQDCLLTLTCHLAGGRSRSGGGGGVQKGRGRVPVWGGEGGLARGAFSSYCPETHLICIYIYIHIYIIKYIYMTEGGLLCGDTLHTCT